MFTPYHAGEPADWDEFLDFCGVWLLDSGDPGYDDAFDVVDDNVIDLKDFAVFAASWDLPSSEESDWYYLHDALGSVRMVVGYDGQTVSVANGYTYRPFGGCLRGECREGLYGGTRFSRPGPRRRRGR